MARPYRLGKRGERAAGTRRRILDAAIELVAAAGFHPASVDDIAARAGTTRPTVYRHFGTKHGLFEAVAWEMLASAGLDRVDEARSHPDVAIALRSFLVENCRMLDAVGSGLRAVLDAARDDAEVARVLELTYYGRRIDSLRDLAGRLAADGAIKPSWTVERVVDALIVLTSVEVFDDLRSRRGHTWEAAADLLHDLTAAFTAR